MKKRLIDWDDDYAKGQWDGFGDEDQRARYALLGGLISLNGAKTVLDVGCGRGLLRAFIPDIANCSYTGIDISQVAIDGVATRQPHEGFVCGDFEDWQTEQHFDAIVLNEVLYYLNDPLGALTKAYDLLRHGGLLIVSVFRHPSWRSPNHRVLKLARRALTENKYNLIEDIEITSRTRGKRSWSVLTARALPPTSIHAARERHSSTPSIPCTYAEDLSRKPYLGE